MILGEVIYCWVIRILNHVEKVILSHDQKDWIEEFSYATYHFIPFLLILWSQKMLNFLIQNLAFTVVRMLWFSFYWQAVLDCVPGNKRRLSHYPWISLLFELLATVAPSIAVEMAHLVTNFVRHRHWYLGCLYQAASWSFSYIFLMTLIN